jgi:hypothetical protein
MTLPKYPQLPLWIRYHGFNLAFCIFIFLGLVDEFLKADIFHDYIFFAICGFSAGSFYQELHRSMKDENEKEYLKRLEETKSL